MLRGILAALVVLLLLASCGGGGSSLGSSSAGDRVPAYDEPSLPLSKVAANGSSHGTTYADPEPDNFWNWCMVFAYGNPQEGQDYRWASASLIYGDYGDDGEGWYMHYVMKPEYLADGWLFCDAHVDYTNPEDTKGKPGKFDWGWDSADDPPPLPEVYLFVGTEMPDQFDIAIHATMCWEGYVGEEWTTIQETGWGFGCNKYVEPPYDWGDYSWPNKWGGYTTSTAMLPLFDHVEDQCYVGWNPGPLSYWNVTFDDDTWYPFPGNNDWVGWCCDEHVMYEGQTYCIDAYSCYDPTLPEYAQSDHWDLISWIVNEMNNGDGSKWYHRASGSYNYQKVQRAIWHFKYGNAGGMALTYVPSGFGVPYAATNADVAELISDAETYGENYYPGPGEWYAVILYDPTLSFQINFIEVDP